MSAGDSTVAGASVAAGLVISVAAGALVGAGVVTGATVSVFCSHAARSAAPARIHRYFFIIGDAHCFNYYSQQGQFLDPTEILSNDKPLAITR